jgi:outer membrane protein
MLKIVGLILLGTFMAGNILQGQDKKPDDDAINLKLNLSLHNIVDLAIGQSSSVRYIQNTNVNSFWRWKNFQKTFLPNLVVSGTVPNFNQSTVPVTQPDGSIEFKEVSNLMSSANLSLNQSIPLTGTYIYASTSASRVQDYYKKQTNFSGNPISFGFYQPIFAYNWMKWSKKLEPMIYNESQRNFIQAIEAIAYTATARFFNYLRVQTDFKLAESALKNSNDNLRIAKTKQKLGQISENDFSRIELSVLNAQKALNSAGMLLKNSDFELKSYVGLDQNQEIELQVPLNITLFDIDSKKALEEAKANRPEAINFERRLINSERDLTAAKRANGLTATLSGSYGLANSSESMKGIYNSPNRSQVLQLTVSVPVLDWGRAASAVKMAESQRDLAQFDVQKAKEDFDRSVIVQVEQFGLLKGQLITAKEADRVAENGYKIALKRFQNGEISITDLNIALSERESAKRDYIGSLSTYWLAYYNLRILTLYDFETDQKIKYENPMLAKVLAN